MAKKKSKFFISLQIDKGIKTSYQTIDGPSWEEVENYLHKLDGEQYNVVDLHPSNEEFPAMAVGGGYEGRVIVTFWANADADSMELVDNSQKDDVVFMVVGGQESDLPGRFCVPIDMAIKVAKYFFETEKFDPKFTWIGEDGK